jgi:hypothetical protein
MRGKRLAVAVLAALLAVAAPAVAASFTTGHYAGKTKQKKKISLDADSANSQINNLKFAEKGKCSDGGTSKGHQGPFNAVTVNPDGTFSVKGQSATGATKLKLNGTISGTKAHGKFKVTSRFTKNGTPNPDGSIKCSTGKVKWSVKLKT